MTEQLAIDVADLSAETAVRTAKPLTRNQQLAYDYVRDHQGVTADEVGAWIHAHRDKRPHSVDVRCEWCAKSGRQTLTSKALRPLLTYRRALGANLYIARDPADRTSVADGTEQVSERIPDDPFAGL